MRFLTLLLISLLMASCGASKKITECKSKPTKLKAIKTLPDLKPEDHNIFNIEVVYYILFEVEDTTKVDQQVIQSHKKLNELYGSAFNFMMHPIIAYTPIKTNIDDSINNKDLLHLKIESIRDFDDGVLSIYCVEDSMKGLLGFTVVFPNPTGKQYYTKLAPKYDYIIVSETGLENINTVPHEVGHVFGLVHPHDIKKKKTFEMFGLKTKRSRCVNIMSYSCCAGEIEGEEVTEEQIGIMWNYCGMNRHNLIKIDTNPNEPNLYP